MKKLVSILFAAAVVSTFSLAVAEGTTISYEKVSVADGVWVGSVSGDVTGRIVTLVVASDRSRPVWDVEHVVVVIADDPSESFVARLSGTIDSGSGDETLRGAVREGYMVGARVEESGRMTDAGSSRYEGTLTLAFAATPAAATDDYAGYPWDDASFHLSPAAAAPSAPSAEPANSCGEGASMDGYPWDDASYCTGRDS